MFPESKNIESRNPQVTVDPLVIRHIPIELIGPVFCSRCWGLVTDWAAVPETAIHENSDLSGGASYVWVSLNSWVPSEYPVVKVFPEEKLWLGIGASYACHHHAPFLPGQVVSQGYASTIGGKSLWPAR